MGRAGAGGTRGSRDVNRAARDDSWIWARRAKEALQRALFYRRVLGAWAFLIAVDERGALERLAALQALEETPLPVVKS